MDSNSPDPVNEIMWVWAGACLLILGGGSGIVAWALGATDPPSAGAEDFLGVGAVFAATLPLALALAAAAVVWTLMAFDRGVITIPPLYSAPWVLLTGALISFWAVDRGVDRQITAAVAASGQSPENFQVPEGWPDFVDEYGLPQIGGGGGPLGNRQPHHDGLLRRVRLVDGYPGDRGGWRRGRGLLPQGLPRTAVESRPLTRCEGVMAPRPCAQRGRRRQRWRSRQLS
jgi:hypothetical protein